MKEFDFLKELNKELDDVSLPMSEKLKNQPICANETNAETVGLQTGEEKELVGNKRRKNTRRNRILAYVSSGVAAVAVCSVALAYANRDGAASADLGCMYVNINPSVAVLYGQNARVEKVVSGNGDGDTLLADQAFVNSLKGKKLEEAAVEISRRAAQTGYLDFIDKGSEERFSQVELRFLYDGNAPASTLLSSVKTAVTEFFKDSGAYVYVETQTKEESGLKDKIDGLKKQSSYVAETLNGLQGDISTGVAAVRSAFYGYATEILQEALDKYALLAEMSAVNDKIKNVDGNFFKLDYWTADLTATEELAALGEEMRALTERVYYAYGDDYRLETKGAGVAFLVTESVCGNLSDTATDFSEILAAGLNEDNFAETEILRFSGFSTALGYSAELTEALQSTFGALLTAIFSPVEETLQAVVDLQKEMSKEAYGRYADRFEEWSAQKDITDAEYQEFLTRIGKANH